MARQNTRRTDPTRREIGAEKTTQPDEPQPFRPPGKKEGLGWARKRDINDASSQKSAPRSGGHYDATGEDEYEDALEKFEEEGGAQENDADSATASGQPGVTKPGWELDEGGVQFERPSPAKRGSIKSPRGRESRPRR